MPRRISPPLAGLALLAALPFALPCPAHAHDIPNDAIVHAYVKPNGRQLYVLVRAPLKAIRDIEFPKRGPGYLDLTRADASLRDGAQLRIADVLEFYEGDNLLPKGRVAEARASLESDKSFASYDDAMAHVTGAKLSNETDVAWDQLMLDMLMTYPIASDQSRFSIRPGLGRLGLRVVTTGSEQHAE